MALKDVFSEVETAATAPRSEIATVVAEQRAAELAGTLKPTVVHGPNGTFIPTFYNEGENAFVPVFTE